MFENISFDSIFMGFVMGYFWARDKLYLSITVSGEYIKNLVFLLSVINIFFNHGYLAAGFITGFMAFIQWALGVGISEKFFKWKLSKFR